MTAEVATGAASFGSPFHLLIGGELVDGEESLEVINPATGAVFAHCPAAGKAQLEHAIVTARHAGVAWAAKSFEERAAAIKVMAAVLRANQDSLAELLTREQGKPVGQSRDEIGRAASQSEGMAAIPVPVEKLVDDAERRIELHYRPLGVVGIITPWNAPINLAAGPLVAALYTGNTVILKPSPYTPLCTLQTRRVVARRVSPGSAEYPRRRRRVGSVDD